MKTVTAHQGNDLNDALKIGADGPGQGNASHIYRITSAAVSPQEICVIRFQNGPIKEAGVNGITNEALLAIVADRLEGFQSGPYACEANAKALFHCQGALSVLHERTREREARGVEGTHTV